jgi:hypothetical protein
MPVLVFTAGEVFGAALDASRDFSQKILKLADLSANPLSPGETADTRRHQIAKLGKALAESFLTIDKIIETTIQKAMEQHQQSDVTAGPIGGPDKPSDPDPNAN